MTTARSTFNHALGNRAMRYVGVSRAKLDAAMEQPLYGSLLAEIEATWPCDRQKIDLACDVLLAGSGFEPRDDAKGAA